MESASPKLDAWLSRVESDLKGRSYASVFWQLLDGFAMPPLSTAADTARLPHLAVTELLRARLGFAARALVHDATPDDANRAARRALERGAQQIEFCLDSLAQDALEPGAPVDGREDSDRDDDEPSLPGDGGIAIHCRADLDAALAGIDIATTDVSFSAGEGALPVLAWWLRHADVRGVPRHALRGGLDVDPIARLTMRRIELLDDSTVASGRAAIEPVFGETIAALRVCAEHCPNVRPLVVDGQGFHLIGASPALELGATIASAIDVARRLGDRGVTFDAFAAGVTVRVQVGHELLVEIAKLRALRLLWAKVARAFGATSLVPSVLGVTSGRFRAERFDQRTNLIRSTLAGFAAVVGGCDAVSITPFADDAGTTGSDLALDQLNLLREEAHLDRSADPFGGSFAIEKLTDEIGRRAWDFVREIDRAGGLIETVRNGALGERLGLAETARERAFRTRRRVLVGISRFADPELGGPAEPPDRASRAIASTALQRDANRAQRVVAAIGTAAPERFFEFALADDADHATLAELATSTWPPEGVAFEHGFLPVAVGDGHEFEDLRSELDAAREDGEEIPTVLLVSFGDPKLARARAEFARDLFGTAGVSVADLPHFDHPAAAAPSIRESGARIVVLCSADGAYADAVPALRSALGDFSTQIHVAGRVTLAPDGAIDGAIWAGMDVIEFLTTLLTRLGILVPELDGDRDD